MKTTSPHILSLVGGGGKTTTMFVLAERFAAEGKKVLVTTTTHIRRPDNGFAEDAEGVRARWAEGRYAVLGTRASTGKLSMPPEALLRTLMEEADLVLIEADGAKRLPCKVPAAHEPVILPECGTVLAVAGMDAVGQPLAQACFRTEEAQALLGKGPGERLTPEDLARILASERGARKGVGSRAYHVVLNKCDDPERTAAALEIRRLLAEQGIRNVHLTKQGKEL